MHSGCSDGPVIPSRFIVYVTAEPQFYIFPRLNRQVTELRICLVFISLHDSSKVATFRPSKVRNYPTNIALSVAQLQSQVDLSGDKRSKILLPRHFMVMIASRARPCTCALRERALAVVPLLVDEHVHTLVSWPIKAVNGKHALVFQQLDQQSTYIEHFEVLKWLELKNLLSLQARSLPHCFVKPTAQVKLDVQVLVHVLPERTRKASIQFSSARKVLTATNYRSRRAWLPDDRTITYT